MIMKTGKFHATDLEQGELAVKCPACPNPTVNLPPGWENDRRRYVRSVIIIG